jgi:DnaD/phage-associated family protein
MARPWVKHWLSKLADPKIAKLPDWMWRRLAEFEMLAGYEDADGKLPPVDDIVFMLHLAPNKVEEALRALSKVGVVHQETDGSWHVNGWKRAQNSASKERTQKYRENKKRHGDGHGSGDDSSSSSYSLVVKSYESEIGTLTAVISDDLQAALEEYPVEWITNALQEAARNNKRSWKYALAILKRWKAEGYQTVKKPVKNGKGDSREVVANDDGSFNV